jgi:hypothetical protein
MCFSIRRTSGIRSEKLSQAQSPAELRRAGDHQEATRAAESGEVDMPTLAALLGHSKLNMVMRYAHPQERHQADTVKRLEKVNAARQIAQFAKKESPPKKDPLQFPLQCPKILPFFQWKKPKVRRTESTKRRRSDSNRCIKVLQTSPLPLGYGAASIATELSFYANSISGDSLKNRAGGRGHR